MKISILDYGIVDYNSNFRQSHLDSIELAKLSEKLGYHSFWLTQHHSVKSLSISQPTILGTKILENTSKIKVGFAGFLVHYSQPFAIAEIISTFNNFYPGRCYYGLASNPGTPPGQKEFKITNFSKRVFYAKTSKIQSILTTNQSSNLELVPKNNQQSELFLLITSEKTARYAAKHKYGIIYGYFLFPDLANAKKCIEIYRKTYKKLHNSTGKVSFAIFANYLTNEMEIQQYLQIMSTYLLGRNFFNEFDTIPSFEQVKNLTLTKEEIASFAFHQSKIIVGDAVKIKEQIDYFSNELQLEEIMIVPFGQTHANRSETLEQIAKIYQLKQ